MFTNAIWKHKKLNYSIYVTITATYGINSFFYDYAYCLKRFHSFLDEKFIKNELTVVLNMA